MFNYINCDVDVIKELEASDCDDLETSIKYLVFGYNNGLQSAQETIVMINNIFAALQSKE